MEQWRSGSMSVWKRPIAAARALEKRTFADSLDGQKQSLALLVENQSIPDPRLRQQMARSHRIDLKLLPQLLHVNA